MKIIKKIAAIMLSVMMVLGMCSVVGAEGTTTSGTSAANKGKITINNAIKDQTYTIYQILELESFSEKPTTGATNTGNYAYKVATGWNGFFTRGEKGADYVTIDSAGYVTWNTGKDAASFAEDALAYAKSNNIQYTKQQEQVNSSTITFEDLDLGYYLVDSSVGALCSLNTTDTEVTIQEKNSVPSVEKKVQEDSTNNWENNNTADIGQTVKFQVTINAKTGAENYVLHDVMSEGLTFDNNSVKIVKKAKTGGTESPLTENTEYTLNTFGTESVDPKCTFEVEFKQDFCDTLANDDQIIITYSATLNKNAVVAGAENTNKTKLEYGDKKFTTSSDTTTKTYEIPVFKYTNKNGTEKALKGAEFELYRDAKCTSEHQIKFTKTGTDNTSKYDCYRIAINSETSSVGKITTSADGKFKISGLDADTYYLKEVTAPKGYNKLASPLKIEITSDGKIKVNNGGEQEATNPVKVENNTGSLLPSTGGMGTTLFYIFGAILVIGSGVVLITKKRMK